jgi:hypothetical protein
MIDLSEVITDDDFAQEFTLYRSTGDWVAGRWVENTKETVVMDGTIVPMSAREIQQLPEADRIRGSINIFTTEALYLTTAEGTQRTSDQILWKGGLYKLIQINDYSDFGFYGAVGQKIEGE